MSRFVVSLLIGLLIGSQCLAQTIEVPASFMNPEAAYQRLEAALARYESIVAVGGWPEVPAGPTIRPGTDDARLPALARRLRISGDLPEDAAWFEGAGYDATLEDAVRHFQARHGLDVDGLVGRATLRALNVTAAQRVDQIRINLERFRQQPDSMDGDGILVNVAAFRLYVTRDGCTAWTTKAIVGTRENRTPLLETSLQYVVFNPAWTVPYSIASQETLPKIKQDPDYLARGGYRLLDRDGQELDPATVDWGGIHRRNFPFTLVQLPGPMNQLGRIKFVAPNEHSIFLHDTPDSSLFAQSSRGLSHGCIRLADPLQLAAMVLEADGWTREDVDVQVASRKTLRVQLSEPLPIAIRYWTADADENGIVSFYNDIYNLDAPILRALER